MSEFAAERERRRFAVRVSLLFAAIAAIIGTSMPYLPVWLDWTGLSASEIAVITATPLLVRMVVTPVIAFAADRAGDHRKFLIGLSWAGLLALLALAQARGFWRARSMRPTAAAPTGRWRRWPSWRWLPALR
jgi:PPP family 3-phenylpropionic acid transporter